MISSDALRKLSTLNLTAEQMAGVLSILADGIEKEEKRLADQRDRKRRQRNASRDSHSTVTGQSCDTPLNGSNGFPDPSLTSLNPTKENPPKGGQKKSPQEFALWYAAYPHKVGRGAAMKAYGKALQQASPDELLEGLKRYISTKPPDREYCNPATWLNQERWKDEPSEITASPVNNRHLSFEQQAKRNTDLAMEEARKRYAD